MKNTKSSTKREKSEGGWEDGGRKRRKERQRETKANPGKEQLVTIEQTKEERPREGIRLACGKAERSSLSWLEG